MPETKNIPTHQIKMEFLSPITAETNKIPTTMGTQKTCIYHTQKTKNERRNQKKKLILIMNKNHHHHQKKKTETTTRAIGISLQSLSHQRTYI